MRTEKYLSAVSEEGISCNGPNPEGLIKHIFATKNTDFFDCYGENLDVFKKLDSALRQITDTGEAETSFQLAVIEFSIWPFLQCVLNLEAELRFHVQHFALAT